MHHDEIISQFSKKDGKILYIGSPTDAVETIATPQIFQTIDIIQKSNTSTVDLSKDFDTVIFAEVLELVEDPRELINQFKWHSQQSIIYEFKYDHMDSVDPTWKRHWDYTGLENILTWEFDYVRSLYLGYATIYFCEGPNKYTPDEIGEGTAATHE